MINVLTEDRVFLDYGPVQMMLYARSKDRELTAQLQEAAQYGIRLLNELSEVLDLAKDAQALKNPNVADYPLPLKCMVEAINVVGDPTLTPMAAVAGTFSDLIADWLVERGATKVMINNGGDIAVRLLEGEQTKIGLTSSIGAPSFTHIISLSAGDGIGGVATSGLGGRSFTKGIASAVTVFAKTARVADSCATLIANHCFAEDSGIVQVPAEDLDPNTDIPGHRVTVRVGDLQPETKKKALANAIAKATELKNKGIILGAVVFLDELCEAVPEGLV